MMFEADKSQTPNRWPVVRVPASSRTSRHVSEVVLLSRKFFSLTTHWVRSTVPCCGDDCALCETLPCRGLFYLACSAQSHVAILELGSLSAMNIEQHAKLLHGGLRPGLVFALSRRGDKSPVHGEVVRVQDGVN